MRGRFEDDFELGVWLEEEVSRIRSGATRAAEDFPALAASQPDGGVLATQLPGA